MKRNSTASFLFAACAASAMTACGGGLDGPSIPTFTPSPPFQPPTPVPPPPPPAAPVSDAPYWLAAASGAPAGGDIVYADGRAAWFSGALTAVDPANPTAPVQLEAPGPWRLYGTVLDGTLSGDAIADAYRRYVVYSKGDRIWKVDLAKQGSPPTATPVSAQTLGGADGVCRDGARLFPALPAESSMLVFASPGGDGACGTADDQGKALRLDTAPDAAPAIVDGRPLEAIYDAGGAITGWIVQKGAQLLRQNATLDASMPAVLRALDSADDIVRSIGIAGTELPGVLLMSIQPAGAQSKQLATLDLRSGAYTDLGHAVDAHAVINPVGSDATHFYFVVDSNEVRRFAHAAPAPMSADDYIVREAPSDYIAEVVLTGSRLAYLTWNWNEETRLRVLPKDARGVRVGDATTAPQPASLAGPPIDVTGVASTGSALWYSTLQTSGRATHINSDLQSSTTIPGLMAGFFGPSTIGPAIAPTTSVLVADTPSGSAWFGGATLKLYRASDASLLATYAALPPLSYSQVRADMLRTDAPALVMASGTMRAGNSWAEGTDLYFINGTNAGLTRVTHHMLPTSAVTTHRSSLRSDPVQASTSPIAKRGLFAAVMQRQ